MNTIRKLVPTLIAWMALAGGAQAMPIDLIDVSGARSDFVGIDAGQAAGLAFTLDADYTDVEIRADVFCLGCSGRFVLTRDAIGPGTALADLVFAEFFTGGNAPAMLIDGTLAAATYFLTLIIDTGTAGWITGDASTFFEAADADYGLNYLAAAADTVFPPASRFEALFGVNQYVGIRGTAVRDVQDPYAVPAPAALSLLLLALVVGARGRR